MRHLLLNILRLKEKKDIVNGKKIDFEILRFL
ncbi:hypothetical protein SAMN05443549_104273 [Flavobacterium fluvii]|uniref:Uncharacterized protein n=1 Tax=Flavobacterium fluvii TaxID=468056 RepID=A0A1M5KEH1_9FLAO|nr:hypothetical protein SAMN05443549_104273 [Flavobacterium fluvii]